MKQFSRKETTIVTTASSALLGGAISLLGLLNLPAFYSLDATEMIRRYLIAFFLFSIAAYFCTKWFIWPYLATYFDRYNRLLIGSITLILLALFIFASPYFWTIPEIQRVAICYEPENMSTSLTILETHDVKDGREYPPQALGWQKYPIVVTANACVQGSELALTALNLQDSGHSFGITVDQQDDQQHVTLKLDKAKALFPLGDHDRIPNTEGLIIDHDPTRPPNLVADPWARKWMLLARWVSIVLTAPYFAVVLFGMSETVIMNTDQ